MNPRVANERPSEEANTARLRALGTFICEDDRRQQAAAALFHTDSPGTVESEVAGMSMGAVIPHGARIRIGFSADPCGLGTVVAFMVDGKAIVHRVRWRGRRGRARACVITQGDAMLLPDVPVARSAVLGPVVSVDAGAGWQPIGAKPPAPRRERALSFLVFAVSVALLEIHPRLAQWLLEKLGAAERRHAWTRALLY